MRISLPNLDRLKAMGDGHRTAGRDTTGYEGTNRRDIGQHKSLGGVTCNSHFLPRSGGHPFRFRRSLQSDVYARRVCQAVHRWTKEEGG